MKAQTMHRYELAHLGDPNAFSILQFAHHEQAPDNSGYNLVIDGTSNEEVLKALRNRLKEQNKLGPNVETEEAIAHLGMAGKALQAYYDRMKKESEPKEEKQNGDNEGDNK